MTRAGLVLLAFLAGPARGGDLIVEPGAGPHPWTNLSLARNQDAFQFAVVTDRTGGHRDGVFEEAIGKLNLLQPQFVMSIGDLIEGYTEDRPAIAAMWDEFNGFIRKLSMPFFYVPGNHDVANPVMVEEWKARFGRPYYHFVYRNVLFCCLCTDDPFPAKISAEQTAYFAGVLAKYPSVRWTLVFLHRPLWNATGDTGWPGVEKLLAGRKYTVFAGHEHKYWKKVRQDMRYITLATTGGASEMRGPSFGEFDHVAWVTMSDAGPIVANLLLGGIWDEDVITDKTKGLALKVMAAAPRQAEPVVLKDGSGRELRFALKSVNDLDVPVNVETTFYGGAPLAAASRPVAVELPPNSVTLFEARYRPAGGRLDGESEPMRFGWKTWCRLEGGRSISMEGEGWLNATRFRPITRSERPPAVDGNMDDWPALPYACASPAFAKNAHPDRWTGPADASFRFGLAHDAAGNLFIGVDVTDDDVAAAATVNPWDQDGIMLTVDARPVSEWETATKGPGQTVFLSPGDTLAQTILWGTQWVPSDVRTAAVKSAHGWTAEAMIPARLLNGTAGEAWKHVRFNAILYDADARRAAGAHGGSTDSVLMWTPDWNSPDRWPGSGGFERR